MGQEWPKSGGAGGSLGFATFPPPWLLATIDPRKADGTAGLTVGTANHLIAGWVRVPNTGTLRDLAIYLITSSGNISVAIYDDDGNRLWTTGAIASPGTGWHVVGDPELPVVEGEDLWMGISADNTTAAFLAQQLIPTAVADLNNAHYLGSKPRNLLVATSHPAPASITLSGASVSSRRLCVIGEIE